MVYVIILTLMKRSKVARDSDMKVEALRQEGALHPNPEVVRDEAFCQDKFFDPRDRVQVRYEMLRRHRVDKESVTDVSGAFGVSRQAFYTTEAAFDELGICGLVPRRRGPKRAHKCTEEILDFVEHWREELPEARGKDLAAAVQKQFRVSIHFRSIERALTRRAKKKL
jgi:transposase